jgi:hypothetical protein
MDLYAEQFWAFTQEKELRLELEEGPLFVSYPVGIDAAELREEMRLQLQWTDGADRFGEYNLPVFGPPPR